MARGWCPQPQKKIFDTFAGHACWLSRAIESVEVGWLQPSVCFPLSATPHIHRASFVTLAFSIYTWAFFSLLGMDETGMSHTRCHAAATLPCWGQVSYRGTEGMPFVKQVREGIAAFQPYTHTNNTSCLHCHITLLPLPSDISQMSHWRFLPWSSWGTYSHFHAHLHTVTALSHARAHHDTSQQFPSCSLSQAWLVTGFEILG